MINYEHEHEQMQHLHYATFNNFKMLKVITSGSFHSVVVVPTLHFNEEAFTPNAFVIK